MSQKREKGKKRELIYWPLSSIDENIAQESVTSLHFQVEHVGCWVVFLGEASRQDVRDAWCGDEVKYCQIKPLPPSWKLCFLKETFEAESHYVIQMYQCVCTGMWVWSEFYVLKNDQFSNSQLMTLYFIIVGRLDIFHFTKIPNYHPHCLP